MEWDVDGEDCEFCVCECVGDVYYGGVFGV